MSIAYDNFTKHVKNHNLQESSTFVPQSMQLNFNLVTKFHFFIVRSVNNLLATHAGCNSASEDLFYCHI